MKPYAKAGFKNVPSSVSPAVRRITNKPATNAHANTCAIVKSTSAVGVTMMHIARHSVKWTTSDCLDGCRLGLNEA